MESRLDCLYTFDRRDSVNFTDLPKIHQDDYKDWAMKNLFENLEVIGYECADFVTSMLNLDVVGRPTLGMVAKHTWQTNKTIPRSLAYKVHSEGEIPTTEQRALKMQPESSVM